MSGYWIVEARFTERSQAEAAAAMLKSVWPVSYRWRYIDDERVVWQEIGHSQAAHGVNIAPKT